MASAKLTEEQKKLFKRQSYGLAGEHSAVKICGWTKKSLHDKGVCYKERFYGISCHRCMQCTPVVNWCTQNCEFCWRLGRYTNEKLDCWQEPAYIADEMIKAQQKLLTGFPGAECNMTKWKEAQMPSQVAISLSGEPTIYPKLGELIAEFHKRGMTTFLVTNGTFPEVLKKLKPLPTQLYVTVAAPDKETLQKICKPNIPDAWERLNKTLELLPKLKTRKVIRLTLVKGMNLHSPEKYAELIKKAKVHLIEVKGYVAVGFSRQRIGLQGMPYHEDVKKFAEELSNLLKMPIVDEQRESRVVLLSDWSKDKRVI
jgi:tRNA wybutosine-synthesizing protein 1